MSKNFSATTTRFAQKTKRRMSAFRRGVMISLFRDVVMDTPVGNVNTWNISESQKAALLKAGYVGGQLRGAWKASIGAPIIVARPNDKNGNKTVYDMTRIVSGSKEDSTVFFVNAMPYAQRVEYDGWSHTKAPEGMVRKNIARIRSLTKRELARAKATNP